MSQNKRIVKAVGNLETALKYEVIANGTLKLIARSTMNVNERDIDSDCPNTPFKVAKWREVLSGKKGQLLLKNKHFMQKCFIERAPIQYRINQGY